MTMITPSYLGETIEYSSLHACRSTLEDPTIAAWVVERTIDNIEGCGRPTWLGTIMPVPEHIIKRMQEKKSDIPKNTVSIYPVEIANLIAGEARTIQSEMQAGMKGKFLKALTATGTKFGNLMQGRPINHGL